MNIRKTRQRITNRNQKQRYIYGKGKRKKLLIKLIMTDRKFYKEDLRTVDDYYWNIEVSF